MKEIRVLQSADPTIYAEMFFWSNRATRAFCQRHMLRGDYYLGIKRGSNAWQASYNRIFMLKNLLEQNFRGWAIWLDADAYVRDIDFDIRTYLEGRQNYSLVIANSGASENYWDVNNGIFMINFERLFAQLLVESWYSQLSEISREDYARADVWNSIPNDQDMFQRHLRDQSEDEVRQEVYYEDWSFINSGFACFIKQVMRTPETTIQDRTNVIKADIIELLGLP